jgi:hypothetical protein
VLAREREGGPRRRVSGVTVLGLDPRRDRGRRACGGRTGPSGRSTQTLADDVAPGRPVALRGLPLPSGRIELGVPAGIVSYAARRSIPDGSFRRVELGDAKQTSRRRSARTCLGVRC